MKTIPLSRLETDLKKMLNECADSGETVALVAKSKTSPRKPFSLGRGPTNG